MSLNNLTYANYVPHTRLVALATRRGLGEGKATGGPGGVQTDRNVGAEVKSKQVIGKKYGKQKKIAIIII
jgi:hypothetical protein